MYKYAKCDPNIGPNIPCGSRVISIGLMLSKALFFNKAVTWLDNVDMHVYAKFDQTITCGSRNMRIFANC